MGRSFSSCKANLGNTNSPVLTRFLAYIKAMYRDHSGQIQYSNTESKVPLHECYGYEINYILVKGLTEISGGGVYICHFLAKLLRILVNIKR